MLVVVVAVVWGGEEVRRRGSVWGEGAEGAGVGSDEEGGFDGEGAEGADSDEKSLDERVDGDDGAGEVGEAGEAGLNESRFSLVRKPPPPADVVELLLAAPFAARDGVGLSRLVDGEPGPVVAVAVEAGAEASELASARSTGSKTASPVNSTPRLANLATRWSVPASMEGAKRRSVSGPP